MKKRDIAIIAGVLGLAVLFSACGSKKNKDGAASEPDKYKRLTNVTAVFEGDDQKDTVDLKFTYNDKGIKEAVTQAVVSGESGKTVHIFDGKLPFVVQETIYDATGATDWDQCNEYDEKGNVVRWSEDQWQTYYINSYDDDGNLIQCSYWENDTETVVTTYSYEYHENGQKRTVTMENHGEDPIGMIWHYNEEGLLVKKVNTYDGSNGDSTTYEYDGAGKLVKEYTPDEDREYEYDDRDRLVKVDLWGEITEYQYNDEDQLIRCIEYGAEEPDELWTESLFQYDADGDLTQIKFTVEDATATISFQYENVGAEVLRDETQKDYTEYAKAMVKQYLSMSEIY